MDLINIEGQNYSKESAKNIGCDPCQKCAFYDVIMTPFQTKNICIRPPTVSCESPESIYFVKKSA